MRLEVITTISIDAVLHEIWKELDFWDWVRIVVPLVANLIVIIASKGSALVGILFCVMSWLGVYVDFIMTIVLKCICKRESVRLSLSSKVKEMYCHCR